MVSILVVDMGSIIKFTFKRVQEQTDSNQRGGGKVIKRERREGSSRNMYKGPMDRAKGVKD